MKKKLIALVLALSACFSMTACDVVKDKLSGLPIIGGLINKDSSTEDPAEEYDLDGAKKLLESRVKTKNAESREEYAVPASFQLLGVTYTVEWSVDVDNVKLEKDGDEVYVNVYEASLLFEDTPFVLTAKIFAPDGTSIETKMNRIVPKLERYAPAAIMAKPQEDVAYKLNAYSVGKSQELYFAGETAKYSYYLKTTDSYDNGVDVYAEHVEGSKDEFYLYHILKDTGAKQYINIVQSGTHINAQLSSEPVALKFSTKYGTFYRNLDGIDCVLATEGDYGTFGGAKAGDIGEDISAVCLVEEVDRLNVDDEDKLKYELTTLNLAPAYLAGGESATIVTHGSRYPDVKISWKADSNAVSLKRTVLSFNDTETSASVTLTATLTIGDKTKTKALSFTVVPNKTEDILAAAAAFNSGEAFGNSVELTGVVVSIDEAYDATHDNVTFTMKVGDTRVQGYHMKGDGADVLAPGFTVTCSGEFMNFKGTLEFSSGRIESYEVGEAPETPEAPETAEEILNALYALANNETMTGEFTLTGKITALDGYNNPTIVVEGFDSMPVYCYRLSVENKIGDVITVTAKTMKNYGGTYEFMDCTLVNSGNEGGNEGEGETTSGVTIAYIADANNWVNEQIAESFTYGDFTVSVSAEKPNAQYGQNTGKYYTNGENWRIYQGEVPSIVVSAAEGKYITSVKITYTSEKTGVLLYGDTQIASDEVVTASASSITFGVGNTGDATNGQVRITAIDVVCADGEGTGTVTPPTGGDNEGGEGEVTPPAGDPNASKIVTAPAVDTAYNFYLYQGNTNEAYYLSGGMDNYYFATSTTASNAITVYLEAADNGYYLYTYVDNVKTYINMVVSDTGFVNGAYEETASTVYTFNTEYNTLVSTVAEKNDYYFFGTRNDKNYGTMGPCASQYIASNFLAHFIEADNSGTVTPPAGGEGEGETPVPPTGDEELQENVAYKFYMTQSNGINYYFTGETASGYKFLTSVYPTDAIDVYAEKADAGYYFTVTVDDTKMYMGLVDDPASDYVNLQLVEQANATAFTYNADVTAWCATVGGVAKYIGTYNAYTHIQNSNLSYLTENPANIGKTQFPAQFMTAEEAAKLENDTERVSFEAENVTLTDAVEGERTISLMTAGKVYTKVTVEWAVTEGTEIASIAEGKLVITNPTAETTVKVVATIKSNNAVETKEFIVKVTPASDDGTSKAIATFDFGANGSAAHVDGNSVSNGKAWSADGYTLTLNNVSKVYDGAFDAAGNSCIKMGTSDVVGSFTFTVEEGVNKVVIYAAKYKAKNSKVTINGGTAKTLSVSSNDGAYEAIEIDTSVTKTITVATVSSNCRIMINTIEFWS